MPKPCSVCVRLDRGEIDRRLSFQVINMSQLARELGLSRDALYAHRKAHLPTFLPAFQASAEALTLGTLQAEMQRLHSVTLDALARAEAGTLVRNVHGEPVYDAAGDVQREVSTSEVARMIREARQNLGLLTKLSADAASTNDRPAGVANGELDARLTTALERVVARSTQRIQADTTVDGDAGEMIEEVHPAILARITDHAATHPGDHVGQQPGAHSPPSLPQFSDTPNPSSEPSSDSREFTIEGTCADCGGTGMNPGHLTCRSCHGLGGKLVKHPHWHGSPAATPEERRAEGYEDIPVQENTAPSDAMLQEQVRLLLEQERQVRSDRQVDV